ncbi:HAD family hydrolase [Promicromonospora sp. NPDC059942]|uniref:HAD family hydrolase n=1 Tax=Promicromonospora sp. NPDC059942 TaxID=3347009 RepID=UPI00365E4FF8
MSRAASIFAAADAVLLDFDGPVTPLIPAPANLEAANSARAPLLARGIDLGDHIGTTSDHLAVLRWSATNAPQALAEVEALCDDAETAAASTAEPTHGAHDLLRRCYQVGKPVAIVSNNAEVAIHAYLERWSLAPYVAAVIGRPRGRPDLMKPNTHTVDEALRLLHVETRDAVFIGDSVSDVEVSLAVGVPCIGYAKTPLRGNELQAAGAYAVTSDMADLSFGRDVQ